MSQRNDRRSFLKRAGFLGLGIFATPRILRADGTPTPRQTEGPFFPATRRQDRDVDLTRVEGRKERAKGRIIVVRLQVRDKAGNPVAGAMVDLWQACASGKYDHPRDPNPAPADPNFQYWAHVPTDEKGELRVRTIVPGAYPAAPGWKRPPHIHYRIDAWKGSRLTTQMYFADHQELNEADGILQNTARRYGKKAANSLVVAFDDETRDGVPLGTFRVVLGKTPPEEH